MSLSRDMQNLLVEMESAGFTVTAHSDGKVCVIAPNTQMKFLPTRASIQSTVRNARSWARRNGMVPDTPMAKKSAAPSITPLRAAAATKPVPPPVVVPDVADPVPVPVVAPVRLKGPDLDPAHPAYPLPDAQLIDRGSGAWTEANRLVDPVLARRMLEFNEDNRPVQQRKVDSWARTMTEGGWVEEICDPLRFADTGKLLDGQKRLLAVIASGVPIKFDVITGLPVSSQDVMDSGQHRSVANQLKINGYRNWMVVAASARLLWLWEHKSLLSGIPSPSNIEVLDFVIELNNDDKVSIETSSQTGQALARLKFLTPSVVAACHYRMSLVDPAAADDFFHQFGTGAISSEKSPILALRETLRRRREGGRTIAQAEQVYMVSKAWGLWRKGKESTRIQLPVDGLSMEAIPEIK